MKSVKSAIKTISAEASKICDDCGWGIKSFGNFALMHVNDVGYRFFMFDMIEEVIELIRMDEFDWL